MPPFKQPKSLQARCVDRTSTLVRDACIKIDKRWENATPERVQNATVLQQHLQTHAQPLMDQICARIFAKNKHKLGKVGETVLKVFSHQLARTLRYRADGNLCSEFWNSCIPSVPNLIELDLSNLVKVHRHMLLVISDHCDKLQVVFLPFLCVSTQDLCLLAKIKTLRIIENRCVHETTGNTSINYGYNFKGAAVAHLLSTLPMLEYIDCNCTGALLGCLKQETFPSLKHLRETSPTSALLKPVARKCPNLDCLVLGSACDLTPLVESRLQVSKVKLENFSFDSSMEKFLIDKGMFLRSLEMDKITELNAEQLRDIGRYCRCLLELTIYLRAPPKKQRDDDDIGSPMYNYDERIFRNLMTFSLSADERSGKTYVGLLLCVARARRIQAIVFKEGASVGSRLGSGLDGCMTHLMSRNTMEELESMIVRGRNLKLSKEMIKRLHDLPKIKTLTLKLNHDKETTGFLDDMKANIACNNLALKLNY